MKAKVLVIAEPLIRFSFAPNTNFKTNQKLNYYVGGDGLNVSCLLGKLNHDVSLVAGLPLLSENFFSQAIVNELHRFGVKTSELVFKKGRVGKYFFQHGNDFMPANVLYDRSNSSFLKLNEHDLHGLKSQKFKLVHISGISLYGSSELRTQFLNLIQSLKANGAIISVDLNFRTKLWNSYSEFKKAVWPFLELATIVFGWVNKTENFNLLDFREISSAEQLKELTDFTIKTFPNLAIITSPLRIKHNKNWNGVKGFVRTNDQCLITSEIGFEPRFPIGAGDAYVGAFLSNYLKNCKIFSNILYARNSYAIKHIYEGDVSLADKNEIENDYLIPQSKILR